MESDPAGMEQRRLAGLISRNSSGSTPDPAPTDLNKRDRFRADQRAARERLDRCTIVRNEPGKPTIIESRSGAVYRRLPSGQLVRVNFGDVVR